MSKAVKTTITGQGSSVTVPSSQKEECLNLTAFAPLKNPDPADDVTRRLKPYPIRGFARLSARIGGLASCAMWVYD